MNSFVRKLVVPLAALASAAAVTMATVPLAQALPQDSAVISEARALAEGTGMSVSQAEQRLQREGAATALAQSITTTLNDDQIAGVWIDSAGELQVAVTDEKTASAVRARGAHAVKVKHSHKELDKIVKRLDKAMEKDRSETIQSWGVDPLTNQVEVTVNGQLTGQLKAIVNKGLRDGAVRVTIDEGAVTTNAAVLYGGSGYVINNSKVCSSGFNAKDASGMRIMLTAGHCTVGGSSFTYSGVNLGTLRGSSYPGNDFGAVNLAGSIAAYPGVRGSGSTIVKVTGAAVAPIGASICKSGVTTKWTCGVITSRNNSVSYGAGIYVTGMTRTTACVEKGDSGGANISGTQAQGITSGASLYSLNGQLVCGAKVGKTNSSYIQPIVEALTAYRATLITG